MSKGNNFGKGRAGAARAAGAAVVLTGALWGNAAFAVPTGSVDFQPGNGHFTFDFSGGASEFTGASCATCDLTDFSVTDMHGQTRGLGSVASFDLTFDTLGAVSSWSFALTSYSIPCEGPAAGFINCEGAVSTDELSSTAYIQRITFQWPRVSEEVCEPSTDDEPAPCGVVVVQRRGGEIEFSDQAVTFTATTTGLPVPAPMSSGVFVAALAGLGLARRASRRA